MVVVVKVVRVRVVVVVPVASGLVRERVEALRGLTVLQRLAPDSSSPLAAAAAAAASAPPGASSPDVGGDWRPSSSGGGGGRVDPVPRVSLVVAVVVVTVPGRGGDHVDVRRGDAVLRRRLL